MEFNYGLERKRFEREWNKLRQQYRKAGMDEEAIAEMYAFDLELFNDERAIAKWEQPFHPIAMKATTTSLLFFKSSLTP